LTVHYPLNVSREHRASKYHGFTNHARETFNLRLGYTHPVEILVKPLQTRGFA